MTKTSSDGDIREICCSRLTDRLWCAGLKILSIGLRVSSRLTVAWAVLACQTVVVGGIVMAESTGSGQGEGREQICPRVGARYPAEGDKYRDPVTGLTVTMLTTHLASDTNLYQTGQSWTPDGKFLLFNSDRSGRQQIYCVEMSSGSITQLTDGNVHASSCCVDRRKSSIYFVRNSVVAALDIPTLIRGVDANPDTDVVPEKIERSVAELPSGFRQSGPITQSASGNLLGLLGSVDAGKRWLILTVDVRRGTRRTVLDTEICIGHLQFNPVREDLLMYCHETGGDAEQRMWLIHRDGTGNRPFYEEEPDDWVTHEVWWADGNGALFFKWPHGIYSIDVDSFAVHQVASGRYWHAAPDPSGEQVVTDMMSGDIFLIDVATGKPRLLTTGHRPVENSVHAHPSFDPTGTKIVFASSRNGNPDVFLLESF